MKSKTLLAEIEHDAINEGVDLTAVLRKCVALGGQAGSEALRRWATLELKGYGPDDELPDYRTVAAPIALDGVTYTHRISGQQIRPGALPEPVRGHVQEHLDVRMPLAEITEAIRSANRGGDNIVRIAPPGASDIAALMNYEMRRDDPHRVDTVTRVYWEVHVSSLVRVVDVVRTTVVELAAELRAGTPWDETPSKGLMDQAVNVAIHGDRNRIKFKDVQVGDSRLVNPNLESKRRRWMWWAASIATVLAAVIAFLQL